MSDTMSSLADHLHRRRDAVLGAFRAETGRDPASTTADRLTRTQFEDNLPDLLEALERALRGDGGASGDGPATVHGTDRWRQGYGLGELVREFGHLHVCLGREVEEFARGHPAADPADLARAREVVTRLVHDGVTASVVRYHGLQQSEAAGRVRALEAALAELGSGERSRGKALRAASHDLRGGLQLVTAAAAVLGAPEAPEEVRRKSVKRLQNGLSSLRAMLNELTDLARLEAGQERPEVARFDAARTLTDLCAAALATAEGKGLYLRAEGPDELWVEGDEGRVRRVAQNLLLNALKYTAAGGVTVRWQARTAAAWEFSVADTGPGLRTGSDAPLAAGLEADGPGPAAPPAPAPDAARPEGGEGIGLSIVKRLCELLDAGLELESEPGRGSTFRVTLPTRYDGSPAGPPPGA